MRKWKKTITERTVDCDYLGGSTDLSLASKSIEESQLGTVSLGRVLRASLTRTSWWLASRRWRARSIWLTIRIGGLWRALCCHQWMPPFQTQPATFDVDVRGMGQAARRLARPRSHSTLEIHSLISATMQPAPAVPVLPFGERVCASQWQICRCVHPPLKHRKTLCLRKSGARRKNASS